MFGNFINTAIFTNNTVRLQYSVDRELEVSDGFDLTPNKQKTKFMINES